ncbi:hypothetical protein BD413DRAFT_528703 [Trametes elegans]|nr:hypothetical protein BD413DRAFT_528703 [Trametes elegans]
MCAKQDAAREKPSSTARHVQCSNLMSAPATAGALLSLASSPSPRPRRRTVPGDALTTFVPLAPAQAPLLTPPARCPFLLHRTSGRCCEHNARSSPTTAAVFQRTPIRLAPAAPASYTANLQSRPLADPHPRPHALTANLHPITHRSPALHTAARPRPSVQSPRVPSRRPPSAAAALTPEPPDDNAPPHPTTSSSPSATGCTPPGLSQTECASAPGYAPARAPETARARGACACYARSPPERGQPPCSSHSRRPIPHRRLDGAAMRPLSQPLSVLEQIRPLRPTL